MSVYDIQSGSRLILMGASQDGKKAKKRRRDSSFSTTAQKKNPQKLVKVSGASRKKLQKKK